MKCFATSVLISAVGALLVGCSNGLPPDLAKQASSDFHARYNREEFDELYAHAGDLLKRNYSRQQFVDFVAAIHAGLGDVDSSELVQSKITVSSSGSDVRLGYRTRFERGSGIEAFVWHIRSGNAQLVGYNIDSPMLARSQK